VLSDIPKLADIANESGIKLMVDNTFSPMILSPAKLGAHIVVYSMTKFINGKNDCVAGAICSTNEFIDSLSDVNAGTAMLLGPVLDPLRASSILKNLNTLHIRMQHHGKNAMYLAQKFQEAGIRVIYPGLDTYPQKKRLVELMNADYGFGGMLAIDLRTAKKASDIMQSMQDADVGYLAVSLGYFRTLFSNSGRSTSSEIPEEIQRSMGLSEGLVRFSVGLDHDINRTWKRIYNCLKDFNMI
jgi:methionine-gamma-lyase